nr:immunoglobulin light chain junction region [Macaca mulatta]
DYCCMIWLNNAVLF